MILDDIRRRLQALAPTELEVLDESESHRGHAGWREGEVTHVRIRMRASAFDGVSRLARHRIVHAALGELTQAVHALAMELDGSGGGGGRP